MYNAFLRTVLLLLLLEGLKIYDEQLRVLLDTCTGCMNGNPIIMKVNSKECSGYLKWRKYIDSLKRGGIYEQDVTNYKL